MHAQTLEENQIANHLRHERLDVTLFEAHPKGSAHLISTAIYDVVKIMQSMGFVYQENVEIETIFNNFTGLNIPENHPARAEQDTFIPLMVGFCGHTPPLCRFMSCKSSSPHPCCLSRQGLSQ